MYILVAHGKPAVLILQTHCLGSKRAREFDPLASIVNSDLCTMLFFARKTESWNLNSIAKRVFCRMPLEIVFPIRHTGKSPSGDPRRTPAVSNLLFVSGVSRSASATKQSAGLIVAHQRSG